MKTPTKVGYAHGKCPVCERSWRTKRPTEIIICDCFRFCPICSPAYTVPMDPFTPDLTPSTYGDPHTIDVLHVCNRHSPPYYSKQRPVEVRLT